MREITLDFLERLLASIVPYKRDSLPHQLSEGLAPVSYTHLTLPTIYSV